MLKCGFYEADITPFIGGEMPGNYRIRNTITVFDKLYVSAFAAQTDDEPVIIIALDALMIDKDEADRIRQGLSKALGIPAINVSVAATHTHTGGPFYSLYCSQKDEAYCSFVVRRAVDAGAIAVQRMEEARIGVGQKNIEGIGFNRRYRMKDGTVKGNPGLMNPDVEGPADILDTEMMIIRVERLDGSPMGMIVNYALHPDSRMILPDKTQRPYGYSGDFISEIRKNVRREYGEEMAFLFMQGASGNVNHLDITKPRAEQRISEMIGEELSHSVLELFEYIQVQDADVVKCTETKFLGHTKCPTLEDYNRLKSENVKADIAKALNRQEEYITIEVWAMRIGDVIIHMLPGELFAFFGLELKKTSKAKYNLVCELSNCSIGYIYTKEAEKQGGYEVTPSTYIIMDSDAGYQILKAANENVERLMVE